MLAERDTTDRYLASYLNKRVGEAFDGKVSGIARFGIFVKLDETGADGLVPMRELGREFFNYDADRGVLDWLRDPSGDQPWLAGESEACRGGTRHGGDCA